MADEATQAAQPVKDAQEAAKLQQLATDWLKVIEGRRDAEKTWREEQAPKVVARYRDDRELTQEVKSRFNIFTANVETLKPAIFARMPVPDVRRRYATKDPAARTAALIGERALGFYMEKCDFEDTLDRCNEDTLVPGRAALTVRYKPIFETFLERQAVEPLPDEVDAAGDDQEGDAPTPPATPRYPPGTQVDAQGGFREVQKERVVFSEVAPEYTPWNLLVFGQAKTWRKVPWAATGALLSKAEVKQQYRQLTDAQLNEIQFSHSMRETKEGEEKGSFALFWDIWDRVHRKFIVVAEGLTSAPVTVQDDPLNLEDFLPIPEPIYAIRTNQNWLPKPEYLIYQDQAIQLDEASERLAALTRAAKIRGVSDKAFDNEQVKLSEILKKPDLTIIPVDNFRGLQEKGGLDSIIDLMPIGEIVGAIRELTARVAELKSEIYEVTGISDIVRGASVASETATAQQIKAQYSGLRISKRQNRFQRFVRDTFRICFEMIVEHADDATLQIVSGLQVLDDATYAQLKAQKQLEAGQVSQQEFTQALQILRSDRLRGFKIDIETDSTIPADKDAEQQNRVEFISSVAQYLGQVMPAVQSGLIPPAVAREGLLFGVRAFKVGSEFEEVLEQLGQGQDDEAVRGQLSQTQQQLAACQQQLQQVQQENQQLQSDAQTKMQEAAVDARIKDNESQHQMALNANEQSHQQMLDTQQAQFDDRLKAMQAAHDASLKSQKAESDRAQKSMQSRVDAFQKQASTVPDTIGKSLQAVVDTQRQIAATLAQFAQAMQAMGQPKAPSRKRGSITLPSGGVANFELGDAPQETIQ